MTKQIFSNRWLIWTIVIIIAVGFAVWGAIEFSNINTENENVGNFLYQNQVSTRKKEPSIIVVSPNGGEQLVADKIYEIKYRIDNPPAITDKNKWEVKVFIDCLDGDRSPSFVPLDSHSLQLDKGKFLWTVREDRLPKQQCKARIELIDLASGGMDSFGVNYADSSDAVFGIIFSK